MQVLYVGFPSSDLTMEIVRYRLIGPLSLSVLNEILVPATDCEVRGVALNAEALISFLCLIKDTSAGSIHV